MVTLIRSISMKFIHYNTLPGGFLLNILPYSCLYTGIWNKTHKMTIFVRRVLKTKELLVLDNRQGLHICSNFLSWRPLCKGLLWVWRFFPALATRIRVNIALTDLKPIPTKWCRNITQVWSPELFRLPSQISKTASSNSKKMLHWLAVLNSF